MNARTKLARQHADARAREKMLRMHLGSSYLATPRQRKQVLKPKQHVGSNMMDYDYSR